MKKLTILSLVFATLFFGCEQKAETTNVVSPTRQTIALELPSTKKIFEEPGKSHLFELPSEALQVWRHVKSVKPPLVLFSIHPFLDPVVNQLQSGITDLIGTGQADDFYKRGSYFRADPLLLTTQTVSAAIDNELFSEIIWVLPTRSSVGELSLETFQKQVTDAGFLTGPEAEQLVLSDGVFRGKIRSLPFRAVHPDRIPAIPVPVVIHFDTGFFKGLFKNEVATPLYDLVHLTVMRIMQSDLNVLAATFSYSTEEEAFSPDVRFLITDLAQMVENSKLIQKMPESWKLHAEAMYVGNMYMTSKARETIEAAFVADPDNPGVIFALARVRFQQGRPEEALTLIDKAVEFDPGYAIAYRLLAEKALANNQPGKALDFQRELINYYPENPFMKLSEVDTLIKLGRPEEAVRVLQELEKLPWSPVFHPTAKQDLNKMAERARKSATGYQPNTLEKNQ